jgi:hypothetical protein
MSFVPRPPFQAEQVTGFMSRTGQMQRRMRVVCDFDGQWWAHGPAYNGPNGIPTLGPWRKLNVRKQNLLTSDPESGNLTHEQGGR